MARSRFVAFMAALVLTVPLASGPTPAHAADPTVVSLTFSKPLLMRGFYMGSKGEVTISQAAPAAGTTVAITVDPQLGGPANVKVPSGQTKAQFDVWEATSASTARQWSTVPVKAAIGTSSKTVNIELRPFQVYVSVAPGEVAGGEAVTGTIKVGTLAQSAINSGPSALTPFPVTSNTAITLSSNNTSVVPVPTTVTVPKEASSATFSLTTNGTSAPASVLINASAKGATSAALLSVKDANIKTVAVSPGQINSGSQATATVTLDGVAPPNGMSLSLSAQGNHPQGRTVASVPTPFVVPAGQKTATFQVTTAYSDVDVTVQVGAMRQSGYGGSSRVYAPLTLKAAQPPAGVKLVSVTASPADVIGGTSVTGTVTLEQNAPAGGVPVMLWRSGAAVGTVPGSVTVPAGQKTATFTVTTTPHLASEAQRLGIAAHQSERDYTPVANVMVQPTTLDSVGFGLTIKGATSYNGTVKLNGPAPQGGVNVTLASSNSAVLAPPAQVTVPAGASSVGFTAAATPGAQDQVITVSATRGNVIKSTTITVGPMPAFEMQRPIR